jgi:hypothetical protein
LGERGHADFVPAYAAALIAAQQTNPIADVKAIEETDVA